MAFLILVIGDLHIPDRALDIPAKVLPNTRSNFRELTICTVQEAPCSRKD